MSTEPTIEPGLQHGLAAWLFAVIALVVFARTGGPALPKLLLLPVPWAISLHLLLRHRERPLARYWWVLPSVVPALALPLWQTL